MMLRAEKTMFRPPGDVSLAAQPKGILTNSKRPKGVMMVVLGCPWWMHFLVLNYLTRACASKFTVWAYIKPFNASENTCGFSIVSPFPLLAWKGICTTGDQ